TGPTHRASASSDTPYPARALISRVERAAPFAAGSLLLGTGLCAAGHSLGLQIPAGPLGEASWPVAILVGGSGAGIILSACEYRRARRLLRKARDEAQRANAQRDVAMLQARR